MITTRLDCRSPIDYRNTRELYQYAILGYAAFMKLPPKGAAASTTLQGRAAIRAGREA